MNILPIEEPLPKVNLFRPNTWPFLMLGFRPLFLLSGIWAIVSMLIWAGVLSGAFSWQGNAPATLWHAHEMLFGFASAIAVGFLFTASKNWTGVNTMNGSHLLVLCSLWTVARWIFISLEEPYLWLAISQGLFWLVSICHLANTLIQANSKHNYQFIVILSLVASLNLTFIWLLATEKYMFALTFSHLAVLGFTFLISVIAGRVTPFFIARGLGLKEQVSTKRLNRALFWCSLIGMSGFFAHHVLMSPLNPGYVLILTAVLHLIRCVYWFNIGIVKVPLLWSLYAAYFCMSLGLLGFGGAYLGLPWQAKDALHLITIGAMGLMILSIMSRVSLGHTARPLKAHPLMSVAFILCLLAAAVRSLLPLFINPHDTWLASAILWALAFAIFVAIYTPILMKKRLDGRRG
ncbi:NnrS family protein [Pseudoalteromonas luteoviolacea]|uniref:NnrS family protein n=1 Tax=Pseudoalteromonas luteoviolacea TaxID=43657 RepID=UPI001B36132C|nr:NnrS family protein [Pseudoalteromonas luteoviolacea]MBQ4837317.1 NnrS family protein [Pseudoalteromonas luteoviolacea]